MAIRYCGNQSIRVVYLDSGVYRCSTAGQSLTLHPPAAGFGPGIAYDSPEAYDQTARAAISFATGPLGDSALEYDDTGPVIRRKK